VKSVTENGEIQTTEALVKQVVDRIQGVIEAKLTNIPYSPTPVLSSAYPCLIYQAPPFYPAPYANGPLQQVGYNVASIPQSSMTTQRIVSEIATTSPPSTAKVYDTNMRCWICNSEQNFS